MKPLPWILAGMALIVVAGVWLLLEDDSSSNGEGMRTSVIAPQGGTELPAVAPDLPTGRDQPVEAKPLSIASLDNELEATENVLPERYAKALGGLTGRIVEMDGTPVPDFRVSLVAGGLSTLPLAMDAAISSARGGDFGAPISFDPILGSDITGEDGRFRMPGIPTRVLGVLVLDPGGPRSAMHVMEESPVSGDERDLGDIVLLAGVNYIGRVIDENQEPMPGVRVRATNLPSIAVASGVADFRMGGGVLVDTGDADIGMFTYSPPASMARLEKMLPVPTTHTDSKGLFELPGVPQGLITLILDDNVHLTVVTAASPSGSPGTTRDMGDMTMPDGFTLEGQVVTADDKPVPGAEVMAGNTMAMGPVTILRPPVTADAEGRFAISGLAPRTAHAVAREESGDSFVPSNTATPGNVPAKVVLPAKRTLTLTLLNESGEKVAGARFLGRNLPDDDAEDMPDFMFPPSSLDRLVTKDEFERYVFEGLAPGMWDLIVYAPGYGMLREVVQLDWEDAERSMTLQTGKQLRVRVLAEAEDIDPLEHALVYVFEQESNDRPISSQRTDEDGYATFEDIIDGAYRVEAEFPGFAIAKEVAEVPAEAPVELVLAGGGTLMGRVVDNGEPPTELLMITLVHEGDVATGDQMPRMTLMAPDGNFTFYNVPEGDVEVSARERIDLANLTSWWEPFAMTPMAEAKSYVTPGQDSEVLLIVGNTTANIATGSVEGRLIVNGQPAEGWKVRTWGEIRRSVSTGPGGRFNMGQLATGNVTLMFSPEGHAGMFAGGGAVDVINLELEEAAHEFVDLAITTGEVRGRVLSDVDGRPLAGTAVVLVSEDKQDKATMWMRRRHMSATDADGFFEFTPVAEGTYSAQAEGEGFAKLSSEPFFVSRASGPNNLVLRLRAGLSFSGVVVLEDVERPADWMWLTAESDTGSEVAARPDTSDGNKFGFNDLSPGTWTFTLYSDIGSEMEEITLRITDSDEDVVLVFRPMDEEPMPEPDVDLIDVQVSSEDSH